MNEGVVAYSLHDFFAKAKILTEKQIQSQVRDFNYGESYKMDKPSLLNFDKHNLNQNASQLYCLFIHLPFIFPECEESVINLKVFYLTI